MKKILIKIGGSVEQDKNQVKALISQIIELQDSGYSIVLVHGGGKEINKWLTRLGKEGIFLDGLRVTDDETMEIVEMVLSGKVNPDLVMEINKFGDKAIGLSGRSAGIIKGSALNFEKYGRVGSVEKIDSEIILKILHEKLIPVIAPIGFDFENKSLNINADIAAAAIAAEIKADAFVFVTDVDGLYENYGKVNQKLISEITVAEIENDMKNGKFEGGMIPKLDSCIKAVKNGCSSAIICNAKTENVLINWMNNDKAIGTLVRN